MNSSHIDTIEIMIDVMKMSKTTTKSSYISNITRIIFINLKITNFKREESRRTESISMTIIPGSEEEETEE